jgi:hypothetical protein
MSKRGSVALLVLFSTFVVATVGAIYLLSTSSVSTTGMVYISRDLVMPPIVNPYGNQQVELPYYNRGSSYQYVYARSYDLRNKPRVTMWDCQTYCFGRPEGGPKARYPKIEYGGKALRGCLAECEEQRLGILDSTVHEWHYDNVRFDRPVYYRVGLR